MVCITFPPPALEICWTATFRILGQHASDSAAGNLGHRRPKHIEGEPIWRIADV